MKIFYLGYYDIESNKAENRKIVLAATNKMSYIIEAIESIGHSVDVISASQTLNRKKCKAKCLSISEKSRLFLFKSCANGRALKKYVSQKYSLGQVYRFIMNTLTPDDILIVYHSPAYMKLIGKAKRRIGFKLIIEIEEIYANVTNNKSEFKNEMKTFKLADSYILPTNLMDRYVDYNKKIVHIHGTYKTEPIIGEISKFSDYNKKVHCVYAGTLDSKKGGARAAVEAAKYLDSNYHMHILGFGSAADTKFITNLIAKFSKQTSATITYDGLLSGNDYIRFIQACDIGLSTQDPSAAFNSTSFPSKILSYMANGLRVVSIRIPAVEHSDIGEYMYYYDKQTPEEIAKAIVSVDLKDNYDGRKIVTELDKTFCSKLINLLEC